MASSYERVRQLCLALLILTPRRLGIICATYTRQSPCTTHLEQSHTDASGNRTSPPSTYRQQIGALLIILESLILSMRRNKARRARCTTEIYPP